MLKTMVQGLVLYGLRRLKEPSTWQGVLLGATAVGVHVSPEMQNYIMTIGIGAAGLVTTVLPDSFAIKG